MQLQLAQRLAGYEVTRPPLGRCTRAAGAMVAAWGGASSTAADAAIADDGLVLDLTT